jgi:hypothetical protein
VVSNNLLGAMKGQLAAEDLKHLLTLFSMMQLSLIQVNLVVMFQFSWLIPSQTLMMKITLCRKSNLKPVLPRMSKLILNCQNLNNPTFSMILQKEVKNLTMLE